MIKTAKQRRKIEQLQNNREYAKTDWRYYTNQYLNCLTNQDMKGYKKNKIKAEENFKIMQQCEKELRSLN
jgi:hypothetical protein